MPRRRPPLSAGRFVLSPLIATGLIRALSAMRILPSVAADPVLTFVLLLSSAMPPAQNSVLMLQVAGDEQGATQMSRLLFAMYALATIPISVLLTLFLHRVGL
jgi:predicted permease